MAKEKKVKYGIVITRPWSQAMYDHNDKVLAIAKKIVLEEFKSRMYKYAEDSEWEYVDEEIKDIQKAVTVIGYGHGFNLKDVYTDVVKELENMPYYRMVEVIEDLEIGLDEGFIGL